MNIASTAPVILTCSTAILLAGRAAAQFRSLSGRVFTDKTVGLRITIPAGWESLPIHVAERRVVGWFQSTARFVGDPKKGDSTESGHAVMKIVRLDKSAKDDKHRYDYAHWLAKTQKLGSYKTASVSDVARHDQVPVVKWDVRIAGEGIDRRRYVAWVFSGEQDDYAVEFRFLEEHFETLRSVAMRSLKTFRFLPATMRLEPPFVEPLFVLHDWLKMPLLERHRRRGAIGEAHEAEVLALLPEGWKVQKSRYFLVLSHTDGKTTRYVHDLVTALRGWLDDRFGSMSDDYPIRTIVRICGNASEYDSYRSGAWRADYNLANREIVMASDRGVLKLKDVLWAVYRRYLLDVAPEVFFNQPTWFRQAIRGLLSRARIKGRKLVFPSSPEELSIFDELRRTGRSRIWTAAELLAHPDFGYVPDKNPIDADLVLEARVLFRFIEGPGERCKAIQGRNFITFYAGQIQKLARELDAADADILVWDNDATIEAKYAARRAAATSAEEKKKWPATLPGFTSRWTSYLRKVRARRSVFARVLFERTCNWSRKDWAQFEKGYERFYKSKSR